MADKTVRNILEPGATPALAPETAAEIVQKANAAVVTAEVRRKQLLKVYREEPRRQMYLSPMYRPYFGNVMTVSVNGISIFFKVDGSVQTVPETFANEITARRIAVDAILTKQSKMADIPKNNERSPGELEMY